MYPDNKEKLDFARHVLQAKARDHARTPVQWTAEENAGFCAPGIKPWMRVNDDYKTINAEAQRKFQDPEKLSVLQFWKRALSNRKEHKSVFVYGDFELLDKDNDSVFAYRRFDADEAFVVVLNFSKKDVKWSLPKEAKVQKWVAGTYDGTPSQSTSGEITIRPYEGLLGEQW